MTKEELLMFWEYMGFHVLPFCEKPAEILIEIVREENNESRERTTNRNREEKITKPTKRVDTNSSNRPIVRKKTKVKV